MASPFSVFRKNQKLMLALLTILAMVGFVFLPIFMEQMGSSKVQNPVAVKTSKYGDLHEREVRNLVEEHHRVLAILTEALQMAGAPPSLAGRILEGSLGPASMENVVNNWLLARYAEQMGMVISDQAVNGWLKMITQDSVSAANFQAAFKHHGLSEFQFFRLMRDELAASQLKNMFETSLMALTPAQRWEYFCRLKQMAAIETVGVPVANYLRRIDEPGDEELKAFFEQYKDRYALPDSPEPGFREPQRIALQYFTVNLEKFSSSVTEEEIKAHYEKNKQSYDQAEKKPESKKVEEPSTKDIKDLKEPSTKSTKDTKEMKPAEKQGAKEAKQPEAAKQPGASPQSEKDKKPKGTSATERPSPFVLTALLKDEKPADQTKPAAPVEKPPAQKPAEKPASGTGSASATPKKEPAPAATAPAPAKPEAKPATPPPSKAMPARATGSASATQPASDALPALPPETKPGLAEATKKRIRQDLAWEKITKVFEGLREKMDAYRSARSAYDVAMIQRQNKKEESPANKPLPPLPPALDFEKLAKQNGLTAGETKLISQWEAQGLAIGASFVGGREPVARYAFLTLAKFHPAESMDLSGDRYLFWKTEETKDRIPEFTGKGVRERVLRAWKMVRAGSLALKDADALAAEARKVKKPLKQALADRPDMRVLMPPAFSWITFGNVPLGSAPHAARISSVAGVDFAGDEFMRTVFHLEPGQISVAMNAPRTMAYVIRLNELSPSQDVLWKQFEVDDFSKYAPAAATDQRQILRAWLDELKTSAGLEWKHKPDQMQESAPREEEE